MIKKHHLNMWEHAMIHDNLHILMKKLSVLTNYIDILFNYNIFTKTNLCLIVFYKKFL